MAMNWTTCEETARKALQKYLSKYEDLDYAMDTFFDSDELDYMSPSEAKTELEERISLHLDDENIIRSILFKKLWGRSFPGIRDNLTYTNTEKEDLRNIANSIPKYFLNIADRAEPLNKAIDLEDWYSIYEIICLCLCEDLDAKAVDYLFSGWDRDDFKEFFMDFRGINESQNKTAWKYNNMLRG